MTRHSLLPDDDRLHLDIEPCTRHRAGALPPRSAFGLRGLGPAAPRACGPVPRRARVAGWLAASKRVSTRKGEQMRFLTLEDETGMLNVIVWRDLADAQRRELLESDLLAVDGVVENQQGVHHLIAQRLHNYADLVGELQIRARNFC